MSEEAAVGLAGPMGHRHIKPSKSLSPQASQTWPCPLPINFQPQPQADPSLTVDVHSPADVCASQCIGDFAGDRLKEEGVIHDGFVEVTGCFFYHLALFCPPIEKERAS